MNIFNCRYWQTEIAFTRMLGHSLMQPCMHDSEFGEHSRELLTVMDATASLYDRIKGTLCFSVRDFRLDTPITRIFAVLAA